MEYEIIYESIKAHKFDDKGNIIERNATIPKWNIYYYINGKFENKELYKQIVDGKEMISPIKDGYTKLETSEL